MSPAKVRQIVNDTGAESTITLEVIDEQGAHTTLSFTLNETQPPQADGLLIGQTDDNKTVNVFFQDETVTINCG